MACHAMFPLRIRNGGGSKLCMWPIYLQKAQYFSYGNKQNFDEDAQMRIYAMFLTIYKA